MSDGFDETGMRREHFLKKTAGAALAATTVGGLLSSEAFAAAGLDLASPKLRPFKPNLKAGPAPNLPKRIAFANVADAEFFLAFGRGIKAGAKDNGLAYLTAISGPDPAKNVSQMETFLRRGICALIVANQDPAAQRATMLKAIKQGVAVMTLIEAPSTVQININQFEAGRKQGLLAAKYITQKLGGQAEIANFNADSIEALRARHQGVLAGLKTAGAGAKIVSDIEPKTSSEAVFAAMTTILQAHPNVKVVIGSDFAVTGALAAVEAAGKVTPDMYFGGMDGERGWLAQVKNPKPPVKTSYAFPTEVFGYAYSVFAADWLKGKSIPKGFNTPLKSITSPADINSVQADMKNPGRTWRTKRKAYNLTMWGNISYATRNQYLREVWFPTV